MGDATGGGDDGDTGGFGGDQGGDNTGGSAGATDGGDGGGSEGSGETDGSGGQDEGGAEGTNDGTGEGDGEGQGTEGSGDEDGETALGEAASFDSFDVASIDPFDSLLDEMLGNPFFMEDVPLPQPAPRGEIDQAIVDELSETLNSLQAALAAMAEMLEMQSLYELHDYYSVQADDPNLTEFGPLDQMFSTQPNMDFPAPPEPLPNMPHQDVITPEDVSNYSEG